MVMYMQWSRRFCNIHISDDGPRSVKKILGYEVMMGVSLSKFPTDIIKSMQHLGRTYTYV